ncbi:MAG TPA: hypothetical protein VKF40_06700 [Burkholderiales bacterium]|nr:hypothetical protein [Burkholderiales bacterium]
MKALVRIGVALALSACMAGCVTPRAPTVPTATVTPLRTNEIPASRVGETVAVGKTKADVIATLGETLVISFDSGFEVWVYRLASDAPAKAARPQGAARTSLEKPGPAAAGEFVVLFAPSGLVAKTRIRLAPLPKEEGAR